jgi:hypothetical protein
MMCAKAKNIKTFEARLIISDSLVKASGITWERDIIAVNDMNEAKT